MSAVLDNNNELRQMTEDDLAKVLEIELATYPFPWTRGIFRDCLEVGYSCWVYEINNEIVAYGIMSMGGGEAHILTLVVRDNQRNQGLGQMIMRHLLDIARQHRVETMLLEVRPTNLSALYLYRKLGFNELGIRPNYYPADSGREDAIIMAMYLI